MTSPCPLRTCLLPSLRWAVMLKPPVCLVTRLSKKLPSLFLTTSPDLPIFTDLPVTTSTTEETSVPVSTSPTQERTCTSESVNMPWVPFLTVLLTTVSSRPLDLPSLSSLITCVLPSVLPPLPSSTVCPTFLPTTPSVLVRMDLLTSLLRLFPVFVSSLTLMSSVLLTPKRLLPPTSPLSPARRDPPPLSCLVRTLTRTLPCLPLTVVPVP
mmetsp:Transcript_2041/g.3355  ORF Transcript_2041/g.3355 Transcript_2041/m.3355 type:complete len:211 (+) Transcript_2041:1218-1850(+)